MKSKIFIDGKEGSTGLTISSILAADDDIDLLQIETGKRKDLASKQKLYREADVVILCLPDQASTEAVKLLAETKAGVIDSSSHFRCHQDWVYGLPELTPKQSNKIKQAKRVANPGCYASGFLLLIKPLIVNKLVDSSQYIRFHAVSGYSGGGRKLIELFESANPPNYSFYALTQQHKHLPEMHLYSGLQVKPYFLPQVGNYRNGLVGSITINSFLKDVSAEDIIAEYQEYYLKQKMIIVHDKPLNDNHPVLNNGYIDPQAMTGKNQLEIFVAESDSSYSVFCRFDNLRKGAAGVAVQNLNLLLDRNPYQLL